MADCLFCRIIRGEVSSQRVAESKNFVAFLDLYPHAEGHVLIAPRRHVDDFLGLSDRLGNEFVQFSQRVARATLAATGAEGFNFAMNTGTAAGQVIFHAHAHIVPRKRGDGVRLFDDHLKVTDADLRRTEERIKAHMR